MSAKKIMNVIDSEEKYNYTLKFFNDDHSNVLIKYKILCVDVAFMLCQYVNEKIVDVIYISINYRILFFRDIVEDLQLDNYMIEQDKYYYYHLVSIPLKIFKKGELVRDDRQ